MKNQIEHIDELQLKEEIIKKIKDEFGERVFVISAGDIFINKNKWANRVVKQVYGIVGGKGQFHWKNPSDICFFNLEQYDNPKSRFMRKHGLFWHSGEIVILKNQDNFNEYEAFSNETYLQQTLSLFD